MYGYGARDTLGRRRRFVSCFLAFPCIWRCMLTFSSSPVFNFLACPPFRIILILGPLLNTGSIPFSLFVFSPVLPTNNKAASPPLELFYSSLVSALGVFPASGFKTTIPTHHNTHHATLLLHSCLSFIILSHCFPFLSLPSGKQNASKKKKETP